VWRETVLSIAREMEDKLLPLFGREEARKEVGVNVTGDVTKYADRVAEDVVLKHLEPLGVNVVSEEIGEIEVGSEYTVLVDPLDGSYNFSMGIPVFALSLAVFRGNKPVYGAIYEFFPRALYEAVPGRGAYLNGSRIHVNEPEPGKESLSFYTRGKCLGLVKRVKRIRVLGAIAVEMAYTARGSLDGVFDVRKYVRPTDIAAGVMLVREAGGIVTDERGKPLELDLSSRSTTNLIAVANERLLNIILEELENEP